MIDRKKIDVDGRVYTLDIKQSVVRSIEVPRLIIPSYLPNQSAINILRTCINSIQKYTDDNDYELWVIDNCSPSNNTGWMTDLENVNVVWCRTQPLPPERRNLVSRLKFWKSQREWGSYANAVGLELGIRLIEPESHFILTLHMDTVMCHSGWLQMMRKYIDKRILAVGVCKEKHRVAKGVLHVLGYLVDFQKFKELGIDFFPDLPNLDVGDKTTLLLEEAGYEIHSFPNTYENPELEKILPDTSPFKSFPVLRVLDDHQEVMFMHLGRGIPKSDNNYEGATASADEWIAFVNKYVL